MKKLLFLLLAAYSCTPKLTVKPNQKASHYPETKPDETFIVLESDTLQIPGQVLISLIEFKDQGLSIDCDYETIKKLVENRARQLGGNCMIITEHRMPDIISSCHRIKCKVLRIPDPERYETQIPWHPGKPLKISNFKGNTEKRPFQAATVATIRYSFKYNTMLGKLKAEIDNFFLCELSYFKPSEQDSAVLAHEQLHFDISEIYARKFRKKISEEASSIKVILANHEEWYLAIQKECNLKQDEYDSEVYADKFKQDKWSNWVKEELLKYKDFEHPKVEIRKK